MSRRNSDIHVRAFDEATPVLRKVGGAAGHFGTQLKALGGLAAGAFSVGAAISFGRSAINDFQEEERAVSALEGALQLLSKGDRAAMESHKAFASEIQRSTVIGDEAVLSAMALGSSMGKLAGDDLQRATKAAIGLSRAFKMDLESAMRLVARAAVGDTGTLKRYGIVLDQTLDPQGKFNELLRIGANNFALATKEAGTLTGQMEQLKNEWGDMKEVAGEFLMKAGVGAKWGLDALRGRDVVGEGVKRMLGDPEEGIRRFNDAAGRLQWSGDVGQNKSLEARSKMLQDQLAIARELSQVTVGDLVGSGAVDSESINGILLMRDEAARRARDLQKQMDEVNRLKGLEESRRRTQAAMVFQEEAAAKRRQENAKTFNEEMAETNKRYLELTESGKRLAYQQELMNKGMSGDQQRTLMEGYDAIEAATKRAAAKEADKSMWDRVSEMKIRAAKKGIDQELALIDQRYKKEIALAQKSGQDISLIREAWGLERSMAQAQQRQEWINALSAGSQRSAEGVQVNEGGWHRLAPGQDAARTEPQRQYDKLISELASGNKLSDTTNSLLKQLLDAMGQTQTVTLPR